MSRDVAAHFDKVRGALFGACVGDSLAMPVHWYYDLTSLKRDFGSIKFYESSKYPLQVPSIMSKSATGTGGRGPDTGEIIGKVICHDKRKYWARNSNYHYHHGLQPGENTLDLMVMRELLRDLTRNKGVDLNSVSQSYIKFMRTPGSHNDVYASTAHRMFFRNLVTKNMPPEKSPDDDGHNVNAIDGLVNCIPVILKGILQNKSEIAVAKEAMNVLLRYRNAPDMENYVKHYTQLCFSAFRASSFEQFTKEVDLKKFEQRSDPMTACYIDSSYPAMLHFVSKHGGSVVDALLRSANAGGENVARGAALGTVLGLLHGFDSIEQKFISGLTASEDIQKDFEEFFKTFSKSESL